MTRGGSTVPKQRRTFTHEFKRQMVQLYENGKSRVVIVYSTRIRILFLIKTEERLDGSGFSPFSILPPYYHISIRFLDRVYCKCPNRLDNKKPPPLSERQLVLLQPVLNPFHIPLFQTPRSLSIRDQLIDRFD